MAEPQPSKLVMRVRFPSPAPIVPAQVAARIRASGARSAMQLSLARAINGPLADRREASRRAVVIVSAPTLSLDMSVDAVGDDLVRATGPVLVDQRGPLAVMPHARHGSLIPVRPAAAACP